MPPPHTTEEEWAIITRVILPGCLVIGLIVVLFGLWCLWHGVMALFA